MSYLGSCGALTTFWLSLAALAALLGGCAAPGPAREGTASPPPPGREAAATPRAPPASQRAPGYEDGRFSLAGEALLAQDRSAAFTRNPQFKQPASIALAPEAVAEKFGHLCKAKKSCFYFADGRAYYVVADYGEPGAKSGSISQIACPVIDGASGTLLRIC